MDNDVIDISNMEFESLDMNDSWDKKGSSSTFGMDLLMNGSKKKNSGVSSDINIDDLNTIEDDLNHLVSETTGVSYSNNLDSGLFNSDASQPISLNYDEPKQSVRFDDSPSIGKFTADTDSDGKTWDGYGKFNNIPVNPDKVFSSQPQLTKEEMLREKFKYLRKLEALEKKGVELTKKYTMESNLMEMQGEYEMIMEEKAKTNSIQFQANMLRAFINGIEFLNNKFDPFDIKLDGLGEQVNENINDYDDIFGELYDKYKSKASLAPELKLLFQLGGSAMMVHLSNTMLKSAMPGMDDILRQNPDLMRSFQDAAVKTMSNSNPGLAGFMGGIMENQGPPPSNSRSFAGPPPPVATQGPFAQPPPSGRPGNNDFSMRSDGINIRETRPEMKGPSDINDLLSGLKTKTKVINIQETNENNDSSTISINDLKELQVDGNMPKRSKRRQKSDKNTVSLDI
jgi:Family of unknown function (DUF5767)